MDKIIVDGEGLSGGERQKIGIMRALTKKSHVIMLDEPTSSLDKASSKALVRVLRKKKKKNIIIMISHDRELLDKCDFLIEMPKTNKDNNEYVENK